MKKVVRTCVAGLAGMWILAGVAQEAAEESTAEAGTQQEAAPENDSAAAAEAAEPDIAEQPEASADAGAPETGAGEPAAGLPEIPPLDELFVPSQNIRADEPVTFPVDF